MHGASLPPTMVLMAASFMSAGLPGLAHADEVIQPAAQTSLVGKTWQLVEIASMNDEVFVPRERARYTFMLNADGSMLVGADCNQGTGSWMSTSPGKLEFSEIASTQALCAPDSLHDRYMAQFPWVRSYVMQDGHLFLATMADGSIIEFEPQERSVAATVLGEDVYAGDVDAMQEIVLTRLFDHYAQQHDIKVSDDEIDAFVERMQRGMRERELTANASLTPDEAAEADRMRREMGRAMIERWKLNQSIHARYGGRIIFQQFGPEPLDAYRRYLEERQAAGELEIHDPSMAEAFWRYFTDESKHDFYETGSEAESQALTTPPWESNIER